MERLIVGIGGSSGSVYAQQLLERLAEAFPDRERVKILISANGRYNWHFELGDHAYADYGFEIINAKRPDHPLLREPAAPMIIAPCSMGLLGRIATGTRQGLIAHCMDRALQHRQLGVMIFRDKPLSLLHTRHVAEIQECGGIVIPATPSFYTGRESLEELARSVVDRALDRMGIPVAGMYRWGETADERLT